MSAEIAHAAMILKRGGLVAFPTETVYGLGADATNVEAIQKIFKVKGRPADHPLIVHIESIQVLSQWAIDIPAYAWRLAHTFWPGPLTLILKKSPNTSSYLTGGQETIGLRIPNHPVANALLAQFGGAIAAPSANRFQRLSPTNSAAVRQELGNDVDYILEGGTCEVGLESTIIDVTQDKPIILRPGMLTAEKITQELKITFKEKNNDVPRVSGSHDLHYAPRTPTILIKSETLKTLDYTTLKNSVILSREIFDFLPKEIQYIRMPINVDAYARLLYATLRQCDSLNYSKIIIEEVPDGSEWEAVRDRLQRASVTAVK